MDLDSSTTDQDHNNNNPTSSLASPPNDETSSGSTTPTMPQQSQQSSNSSVVAGPRPAPSYSVVNAILEKKEDGPGPRCGHTLTAVSPVGEEGTPGYIGPRLILFGGATALEGNSAAAGPPSSAGSAGIRLAGATADVHCYDVLSNKWSRLLPLGEQPSPRAAHVATAVGTMVVIQGGIGPAGLSAEDLHVLDLTQQRPRWHRVVVQGPGPGPRYGHVMALVGQRFLLAIGGNDGKRPLADVWALDTAAKPYEWRKLEPEGEGPPPCISQVTVKVCSGPIVPRFSNVKDLSHEGLFQDFLCLKAGRSGLWKRIIMYMFGVKYSNWDQEAGNIIGNGMFWEEMGARYLPYRGLSSICTMKHMVEYPRYFGVERDFFDWEMRKIVTFRSIEYLSRYEIEIDVDRQKYSGVTMEIK
ncbi:hypothetical protein GIB67_035392 [Kingdonia uniflora]|uniref:Uncharacterized protein n=1 Tax=Kingdonia uniflora TaxID=39325 RepID=A0A7J7MM65_9MAGN|nr:hypothetical protein GIB67_035392 [Kingdonia uniflora]